MKSVSLTYPFLILFLVNTLIAQRAEYKFTRINLLEDVSLGQVNFITEDKFGFIWFSEESSGALSRYDGFNLKRYYHEPGNPNTLGGSYPECILIDQNDIFWIGFSGQGMDRFDPLTETFTHFRQNPEDSNSLSDDRVSAVVEDSDGKLYIATFKGLDVYDPRTGQFSNFRHDPNDEHSLSSDYVRELMIDREGTLWVGTGWYGDSTDRGGLNRFDKSTGKFTRFMANPKDTTALINRRVTALFEDSQGNFWVGTGGDGLHSLDRSSGKITRHPYIPDRPDRISAPVIHGEDNGEDYGVTFIDEDINGNLWIGGNGFDLYNPVTRTRTHFGGNTDFFGTFIENSSWCIHISKNGLIWVSTQPGVYRIDPYNFILPRYKGKIPAYLKESDDVFWTGVDEGVIRTTISSGSEEKYVSDRKASLSLSNNHIRDIIMDHEGMIWVGTENGLNKINPLKGEVEKFFHIPGDSTFHRNNLITRIRVSENGKLIIGTGQGVYLFDRETGKFSQLIDSESTLLGEAGHVSALMDDGMDNIWFGYSNGAGSLTRINLSTGKYEFYSIGNGINDIIQVSLGDIWVACPTGLFKYDSVNNQFEQVSNHCVFALAEDDQGQLWASSLGGFLLKINLRSETIVQYAGEYLTRKGYLSTDRARGFIDFKGNINLGDDDDYFVFDPHKILLPPDSSKLIFTDFRIDGNREENRKNIASASVILETPKISLTYSQNSFSLRFTEIDFRSPAKNRINYLLEGYDNFWRETLSGDPVSYVKVPPGSYTFKITASNSITGLEAQNSIYIVIHPPWYLTRWAYFSYFVLFVGAIFCLGIYQRRRVEAREQEKARIKELEHAKEIKKAYTELKTTQSQLIQSEKMASLGELTAGIAHEIQNPLNFVNNFSELSNELLEEMKEELVSGNTEEVFAIAGDLQQNLEKINHHGKRAEGIVKGMLQHSRTSSGQRELTDINALCDEYLRLAYHGLRAKDKSFNARYETHFDPSLPKLEVIPQDIGRVLLNLINNGFQAMAEVKNPQLSVSTVFTPSLQEGAGGVFITIRDNGPGIPDAITDKIFQPFFTTKPAGQGTGLGLSIAYDIVKAHGGEIRVDSTEGDGTTFTIVLPV